MSSDRPDDLCARSGSAAGSWGDVSESDALATLCSAYEQGVSFFDTADVYGAGRSEGMVGEAAGLTPKRLLRVAFAFVGSALARGRTAAGLFFRGTFRIVAGRHHERPPRSLFAARLLFCAETRGG